MLEPRLESAQDQDLDLYEHVEDAEDETFRPFPPPASPLAEDGEGPEQAEQAEPGESGRRVPVPVKRAKRSIPRLDAQRLISERGLPTLRHVFDKAKFKGKGHEAEDLKTLIRHMEHWAHRLFPKLQFEDFIDRVESLGNKKEVQTCLKRIRLDLPILHEDFISSNDAVEEHEGREGAVSEPDPFLTSLSESQRPAVEPSGCLTEEQQQRMERNKQLAWERRQAKLLSASQAPESDCSLVAPTAGSEGGMPEHSEEQGFNGWDTDEPDCPRNSRAAHREDSPIETAPLNQCP